ncbi:MAG: uracil-DNA glycosylase [Acidimicrobiales bacterium]
MADLAAIAREALGCTRCGLAAGRTQVVFGNGDPNAGLMFIGEGPGAEEDRRGLPFVGRSGQLLDRLLREELNLDRSQVYVGNVVKCRPPGNRDPEEIELEACWPWLEAQLDLIQPAVVVTLGNFAARRLLGTSLGVTKLRGREHEWRGTVLVPTFHPSFILRNGGGDYLVQMRADLVRAKQALVAAGRYPTEAG